MAFSVRGLSKSYAGVQVLRNVDLSVEDGEIHALLGANGAGKSTLIKCISGAVQPDAGEIIVGDAHFSGLTPHDSKRAGVAVIYQDLSLALSLDVTDNIFLGQEMRWGPFVRRKTERAQAANWLRRLGIALDPTADLMRVGNSELQLIEIVKSLVAKPKVLILDEPTASLTEREADKLGRYLLSLKAEKLPLLYVTHRLGEVFDLADRVTVLRGGQTVLTGRVKDLTPNALIEAIVGKRSAARSATSSGKASCPPLLRFFDLLGPNIGPISGEVRQGEILGVFGLVGSGRTELLESLFGARKIHAGAIELGGQRLKLRHPAQAVAAGIALVPSDRGRKSIFSGLSAIENTLLPSYRRLSSFAIRRVNRERSSFDFVARQLNLQPFNPDLESRRFSGGNQQKLVLGRWLQQDQGCKVLLLDEPTQGVDVGARRELYDALRSFVAKPGCSVIMTSSEPDELMEVADRVMVLAAGKDAGVLDVKELTEQRLLALAHSDEHE